MPWNPAVLEQRIGRVHRLGQNKIVQVINLISKNTIEHKILGTLSFKKSTFDGVLDGGENMVLMGESKLKKIMNAVEDLNDDEIKEYVNETNDVSVKEKLAKAKNKKEDVSQSVEESTVAENDTTNNDKNKIKPEVNELFDSGIDFFGKLAKTFNKLQTGEVSVNDFIDKDEKTGETSIKIPVKDTEAVKNIINNIANIFNAFGGK